MRTRFFLLLALLVSVHLTTTAATTSTILEHYDLALDVDQDLLDFPIFGKKKTSNKKQLKFAAKRSRRNGKGVMRARKRRGKNNGRSVKGGQRGKRGSKKKEGCNT